MSKGKRNWIKGKILEEKIYQKIKKTINPKFNHTNLMIQRPKQYEGQKWHTKKKIEIDNMFYYNGKIYIIQAKHRKKNRKTIFQIKQDNLYLDKRRVTGLYLDNLWKAQQYIKYDKHYHIHGEPEVVLILLIEGNLKSSVTSHKVLPLRNVLVMTYPYIESFLVHLSLSAEKKQSRRNEGLPL